MSARYPVRLKPKPLVIGDYEGFEKDLFGLSEYGERLADLVCNVEDPLVTILDGPWGSGKTIFAKQWAGLMRNRDARVIYFDAFANDHYEDALTPLAAQILSVLSKEKERSKKEKLKAATLEVGKYLLPIVANPLIRSGTGGLVSYNDFGSMIGKILEARLDAAGEEKVIFEKFRTALREVSEIPGKQPLVFIVDELDRCRPTFAINLIERVKHLFSVPGVQFLLVAHLPQLEEVVKHCYGLGLGGKAKIYLEKFYDVKMAIPEDRVNAPADKYVKYLWEELGVSPIRDSRIAQLKFLSFEHVIRIKRISLRTTEKILASIALAYTVVPHDPEAYWGFLVEGLCIIRHLDPELYNRIRSGMAINPDDLGDHLGNAALDGRLENADEIRGAGWLLEMWNEVREFFELEKWDGFSNIRDWVPRFWTYVDHSRGGPKYGRYLTPMAIRFARIIDSMSLE